MATQFRQTKSEERILTAAAELFYANGLRGVGIDQVIASSGVAKSTLYAHFRTKEELIAAYLRRTDDSWTGQLQDAARRAGDDPRRQLVGLFDALTDAFDRHGFFGCPFVSAAVEAELDSEARAVTVAHTRRRQEWLSALGKQAGAASPEALARQIGLLIDGALTSGRLLQRRTVVDEAKTAARLLVDAHTVSSAVAA
ncbi:TetR/AcrR family transcriptional regulator [Streptomyces sp. NPDC026665]|uniref:TetR/AcrR family transcriptional regulator n=1 Tax=Streptomyces sp. NPDC026665 TaxID=3154798 RepID=UPI0033F5BF18